MSACFIFIKRRKDIPFTFHLFLCAFFCVKHDKDDKKRVNDLLLVTRFSSFLRNTKKFFVFLSHLFHIYLFILKVIIIKWAKSGWYNVPLLVSLACLCLCLVCKCFSSHRMIHLIRLLSILQYFLLLFFAFPFFVCVCFFVRFIFFIISTHIV